MKFLRRVLGHMLCDEIGNRNISNELQIFDNGRPQTEKSGTRNLNEELRLSN
jgi:hypothetical protein